MIKNFFDKNNLETENKKFLLASSGGPDSMALLQMLINEFDRKQIYVAHFDHQLRKDSYQENQILVKFCKENHLTYFNEKWPQKLHPGSGIEASARKYRYQFLAKVADEIEADYLLTAHHGDDLLENILIKLIRSGDANEMSSLRSTRKWHNCLLVRPLLGYSKQQLLNFDKKYNLPYIEDSTNKEDDVLRNRLRHHVVPLLKEENPRILSNGLRFNEAMNTLQEDRREFFHQIKVESFMNCLRVKEKDLGSVITQVKADYFSYLVLKNWHQQVNFEADFFEKAKSINRDGFEINYYQGYYYLHRVKDFVEDDKLVDVTLNQPFDWHGKTYLVSDKKINDDKYFQLGTFYYEKLTQFEAGSLQPKNKLKLANGKLSKPKKKFAENAVPLFLRRQCLTIDKDQEVLFIENVYKFQEYDENFFKYWVYQLKV